MTNPSISINQLAEFANATPAAKRQIVKQQIVPNKFLIPWYQKAKSAIRKYFQNVNDISPVIEAIDVLANKPLTTKKRVENDRAVSIEALKRVIHLTIPRLLKNINYQVVTTSTSFMMIVGVKVIVAPDIIVKAQIDGRTVYGALKIHIKKTKPFDSKQAQIVSALVHEFLRRHVAKRGELVLPELCLCLDVFSGRLVGGNDPLHISIDEVKKICEEINSLWLAA